MRTVLTSLRFRVRESPTRSIINVENGLTQSGRYCFDLSGVIHYLDEGDPEIVYFKRLR